MAGRPQSECRCAASRFAKRKRKRPIPRPMKNAREEFISVLSFIWVAGKLQLILCRGVIFYDQLAGTYN
jgi:hypothetical protein